MGDIFGGGGGGGGSGGDETNTTEKALPSPAQIAATREAFNTASGIAGTAKNLPYFAQIASSPGYRQALQQTANTWNDWMGQPAMDLSQGMAPITEGPFGSVIDAGQIMNNKIAGLPPDVQKILAQWTGPGAIKQGDAYSPAVYDPYVQQKPLLHQGTAAQGGVGTIGAGGIPTTALPTTALPTTALPGTGTPGTGTPGTGTPGTGTGTGQTIQIGNKKYKKNKSGRYVLVGSWSGNTRDDGFTRNQSGNIGEGGSGQGGLAARGGMARGAGTGSGSGFNHGLY
jgi:hypothetical protein